MEHQIQNFEALTETDLRRDALAIAEAGYAAIDVGTALEYRLRVENDTFYIDTKGYPLVGRRIFFIGVGKCSFAAALAVEDILGDHLTGGVALDVSPITGRAPSKIETYIGTHPLPSEVNETATKRIMEFLADREEGDLVLMLISGGGSTLLCLHTAPMTCVDERMLFEQLTARGTEIADINTVRKHISLARGGALAKAAYPAEVISLIVSDIPGNALESVASGPTVLDSSTVDDAKAILSRFSIVVPTNIEFIETPKEEKYFERVTNILFLSNQNALAAMKEEAGKRNYSVEIVDDRFSGEARLVGRAIAEKLHTTAANTALLYAGESTVTLSGTHGEGGRNQEMALSALDDIREDELLLPFSSDGHDNSDYAGAIADETTRAHAREKNIKSETYLVEHRSYDFFTATGDALKTGYTGSNVSDLIIALKK
ncbi:MAG: DUF4147 domain-containing protein [Patescibacteria group bacterium]|nr:DUF4147 domain-containing protein [Patescibacteria group bacterium]